MTLWLPAPGHDIVAAASRGVGMFIKHYGMAFGAKGALRRVPLWVYFLAVQWLDIVWSLFVLDGIEHLQIQPGFLPASPLVLYDMPYTHGLFGALVLSALFGGIASLFFKGQRGAVFLLTAAAVFSHWILDLLVHAPDLWIYDNVKLGLGLWRWLWISLPLELILLVAGAWYYQRAVPAAKPSGNVWLWGFVAVLAAVELYNCFGPLPVSPTAMAQSALAAYVGLALLAGLVDWRRTKA
jgi:hypothetical protein